MISRGHQNLSVTKQCQALSVHRSGFYYKPKGESALNLKLMELMDKHYLDHPYKGVPSMLTWLRKDKGFNVSKNRVERLYYNVMGLRSIAPGKHTSKRHKGHKVHPYLLRNLKSERPNQVWATDITYIPMAKGFMYLTAVIDVYSRKVMNWSVSNTMEAEWCKELIEEAILQHGKPEIINTDQGSQYTSDEFANYVIENGIKLSMDGKGRATDNAFIERLWRSVKYEKVYLNPPKDGLHLFELLADYFHYYNNERRHQSLEDNIPNTIFEKAKKELLILN